jgi:hypothetical protein
VLVGLKFTRALGSGQAVLLPPNWLDSAGSNLIDQANKVFHNTGIQ